MAISPPGDIILDVARAADPQKLAAAHARLETFARAGTHTFEASMDTAVGPKERTPTDSTVPQPFVEFEAMVLSNFLQAMLPREESSFYGRGLSGDMWRSLLARQLGEVMAERGGIGIARRVLGDHYLEDGKMVPVVGVSAGPEAEKVAEQTALSKALLDEIERQAAKTLAAETAAPGARKE